MKYNHLTVLEEFSYKGRKVYSTICDCGKTEIKRKDWVISGRTKSCKSCSSKKTAKNYPPPTRKTGCEGLSGTHYLAIKHGAIRRGISFDVSPEFLWSLYVQQDKKCALTGVDIVLENKIHNHNVDWSVVTASVDRIDSSLGYIDGNVQWVHKTVNRIKNNYTTEELLFWCRLIVDKHDNPEPSTQKALCMCEGATTSQ